MSISRRGATALAGCALVALALAGCSSGPKKAASTTPYDQTVVEDCYTVDLFTVSKIVPPGGDVPKEWAAYSGKWGSAGWNGKWCHDLYVLKISSSGQVDVMDLHAPMDAWGKRATAYRRKGWISKDGRLRLAYGGVQVEYWLQNGRLYGLRKEGTGELRIAMLPRVNTKLR